MTIVTKKDLESEEMFTILTIMSVAIVAFIGFGLKKINSLEISYWKRALLQLAFIFSILFLATLLSDEDKKSTASEDSKQIEMTNKK